jgi:hypothetical protein
MLAGTEGAYFIADIHSQPGNQRRSAKLRPLYPRKRPSTHCKGHWVGLGGQSGQHRKVPPTGIRSPDRPAHSKSPRRLRYPGRLKTNVILSGPHTKLESVGPIWEFLGSPLSQKTIYPLLVLCFPDNPSNFATGNSSLIKMIPFA